MPTKHPNPSLAIILLLLMGARGIELSISSGDYLRTGILVIAIILLIIAYSRQIAGNTKPQL